MRKCPKCEESYYRILYSMSTALGWCPVYKNGKIINKNPNKITNQCQCLNCGEMFSFTEGEE